MNNKNGFSLIELMVTIAVGGVVLTGIMMFRKQIYDSTETSIMQGNVALSQMAIKKIISQDLINAQPSYGYLNFKGKDGADLSKGEKKCKKNFNIWDLAKKEVSCSVQFTFERDKFEEFYLIVLKTSNSKQVSTLVDPKRFYSTKGSLKFSQSKLNDFLKKDTKLGQDKGFLKMKTITSDYSMLLYMRGKGNIVLSKVAHQPPFTPFYFKNSLAPFCSIKTPKNIDEFLRCVPDFGGGSQVHVKPVRIIRYRIAPPKNKKYREKLGLMALYRGVANIDASGRMEFNDFKLTDYLKRFSIKRSDTSSAILNFSFELEKTTRLKN